MGKHKDRVVTHSPVGTLTAHAVHYTLQKTPSLSREVQKVGRDKRSAYARVVVRESVTQEELEGYIKARNPLLDPTVTHLAVSAVMQAIVDHLKVGRRVTIRDCMSFGVAFEGRVDPERPLDVRHLPLVPWVRFAPSFIQRLNTGVRVAYADGVQPPKVEVKSVEVLAGRAIELKGDFRHPEALAADVVLASGEVLPCEIRVPSYKTRAHVESLSLVPEGKILPGATLLLQWVDGANESRQLSFDL